MANQPFKLRLRRVREDVLVDLLVPTGRSAWSVAESLNLGPGSFEDALNGIEQADLTEKPRLAAALLSAYHEN